MNVDEYVIFGGGEHANVVMECLRSQGLVVKAFIDPKCVGNIFGVPVRADFDPGLDSAVNVIVAIGDNALRKKVVSARSRIFGKAIHPSAIISPYCSVGEGCMILHGVIVQAKSRVGCHVILNTASQVDHNCVIGDFVHVGPGAILCGSVEIGEGSFIGAGATVIPGTKIGSWSTIGAGATVIRDVPDGAVAVGNPARIIKLNNP